jgi:hypothetical protein
MRGLQILKPLELAFTRKIAGGVRKALEPMEEIAKASLEMSFEHRSVAAQGFALSSVEASKTQAVAKAASLRPTCLI